MTTAAGPLTKEQALRAAGLAVYDTKTHAAVPREPTAAGGER